MKTLKWTFSVIVMLFFASGTSIRSQTYQYEWRQDLDQAWVMCLNRLVDGYWIYHVTVHVDPGTGFVDRLHANVLQYDLRDCETGEKYVLSDTGSDNLGAYWGLWDWLLGGLQQPLPDPQWQGEGTMVSAHFKVIAPGGEKFYMRESFQIHLNANGVPVVDNHNYIEECDY